MRVRRLSIACSAALVAVLTLVPDAGAKGKSSAALEGIPRYKHVAIAILENENEATTFGPGSPATYLNSLVSTGAFDPNYYGTGHVSLDNYIAMTSGQPANPLTSTDCEANNFYSCAVCARGLRPDRSAARSISR